MSPRQRALAEAVLVPLATIGFAFLVSGLVVLIIGENPLIVARLMIAGSLGSSEGLGYTLFYTTDFIFAGLAVAVAYQAGLFNIGADGQAYVAGLGVTLMAIALPGLSPWLLLPLCVGAGAGAGALWAFIPAWLQARRGSHIVITTIMFNWLATDLMSYLLVNVLRPKGDMQPESAALPAGARMPAFSHVARAFGLNLTPTPLNGAFILALLAAFGVWLWLFRTRSGYGLRVAGVNRRAAAYAGISASAMIIVAMLVSGALAGGVAVNEVMGSQGRLLIDFTSGFGFVGIAVALMGRGHPLGVVLAGVLFGMLYQGGAELAFDVPAVTRDMILVIQGLVVYFAGALEGLFRARIRALLAGRAAAVVAS